MGLQLPSTGGGNGGSVGKVDILFSCLQCPHFEGEGREGKKDGKKEIQKERKEGGKERGRRGRGFLFIGVLLAV